MFLMSQSEYEAWRQAVLERPWVEAPPARERHDRDVARTTSFRERIEPHLVGAGVDWRNEPGRPPELALGQHAYPVERRPGWTVEQDRWTYEWVYTRDADGAVVRVLDGGTWDDADIDLDEYEREHPLPQSGDFDPGALLCSCHDGLLRDCPVFVAGTDMAAIGVRPLLDRRVADAEAAAANIVRDTVKATFAGSVFSNASEPKKGGS